MPTCVSRTEAAFSSFMDVLLAVALAGLIWLGARRVLSGSLTPGDLLVFISYVREFYGPTRTLSKLAGQISRTSVSAEKIAEVLREVPAVRDAPDARPAPALRGQVSFEEVGFAYVSGQAVLREVSFDVAPGQVLALVGPTGAGKSTIAALIPRLYDPSQGRLLIDGQDILRLYAGLAPGASQRRAAERGAVPCDGAREHRLWAPRGDHGRDHPGGAAGQRPRLHRRAARWLRHPDRRARRHASRAGSASASRSRGRWCAMRQS